MINKDDEITAKFKNEAKGRVKEFSLIEETNAGYLKNDTLYPIVVSICERVSNEKAVIFPVTLL